MMQTTAAQAAANEPPDSLNVVELRRYKLVPGRREALIGLFDREFVESQEAEGMTIIGQFRDPAAPDTFTWSRGFTDMERRARALTGFYDGPVWAAHAPAARATMINSANVLLLRPAWAGSGFQLPDRLRPAPGARGDQPGLVVATICYLAPRTEAAFIVFFREQVEPLLTRSGMTVAAAFVSEHSENTFPRLPVREGETVFAWFSAFPTPSVYHDHMAALERLREWPDVSLEMARRTWRANEVLRLTPTARSRLHGQTKPRS